MNKHSRSKSEFERAESSIPGGVNSPARAFSSVSSTPVFAERAKGSLLKDIDGNEYIDFSGSWGPLILGHAHDRVISDLQEQLQKSTSFGMPTVLETELAEKVISHVPSMDQVRFVNSGTEATMSAIRLARGVTDRDKIIKFRGCYHGHGDSLLVEAGSGLMTHGTPSSPGITEDNAKDTIVLSFNDVEEVNKVFNEAGDEIAGVIVEPVAGNMGVIPPTDDFLSTLRQQTESYGTALIFDEVITGFRLGFGGAQAHYNIQPDITTLGKIIGGGMPVGAFGGRQKYMKHLSPEGEVYQAGTLSGNPISMRAGLTTIQVLESRDPYSDLDETANRFTSEIEEIARKHSIPMTVHQVGSMMSMFFQDGTIQNKRDTDRCNLNHFSQFHSALLDQGIYFPPSQFETVFINHCHTSSDLEKALHAIDSAFKQIDETS